jgi:hypothetical protein
MTPIRARTVWTVLIAFAITLTLPFTAYFVFSKLMTRMITRDNAGIVFDQFQAALDKGGVFIHDSASAVSVAERAYLEKASGTALDGWSNPMRISAIVQGNSCQLIVLSAGADGAFGTADDISMTRSFDLSRPGAKSP